MSGLDLSRAAWRKSSRSAPNNDCVEVAAVRRAVAVRDSKRPAGPTLAVGGHGWRAFTDRIKTGDLDR